MATIIGTPKNDTLIGDLVLDDVISGLEGDDSLFGRGGNDALDGGPGDDILSGGDGADTLVGGSGEDTLDGGSGADSMAGGSGEDTYVVDNVGDVVIELFKGGTDQVRSTIDYTLPNEVENLQLLGAAVRGTGNALVNSIVGNSGDNILDGRGGADVMAGGKGNDQYFVDNAGDQVIETAGEGTNDQVLAIVSYTLAAATEIEVLATTNPLGTAAINLTGNEFAQTIIGNAGNNILMHRIWVDGTEFRWTREVVAA